MIDSSKLKNVSEEDLRTLLTFFPVSGSDGGGPVSEKQHQSEKTEGEPQKTIPKVWPPGSSAEDVQKAPTFRKFPREKLPPRPMVQFESVKPVVVVPEQKGKF